MLNPRQMKGKWARGIQPRNFTWIIKDQLAICERPGGYSRNHRPVRRQEEVIWLRENGFARIVSTLASPHNLHVYDEIGMPFAHFPYEYGDDVAMQLVPMYTQIAKWMSVGDRLIMHNEDVGDLFMGILAGYLLSQRMINDVPNATMVIEKILTRQMGPEGRDVAAQVGLALAATV